jgi:hypothetical protein
MVRIVLMIKKSQVGRVRLGSSCHLHHVVPIVLFSLKIPHIKFSGLFLMMKMTESQKNVLQYCILKFEEEELNLKKRNLH